MMGFGKGKMTCAQARDMDMVSYLSGLGHEPVRIRGNQFWYCSPLRNENRPSFKINRKLNRWYDFGMGKGGNLIDFAIEYHGCTVADFLASLDGSFSFHRPIPKHTVSHREQTDDGIEILEVKSLFHPALLDFLEERRIPVSIADRHCHEVHYRVRDKDYFAIGFANDAGGYELRNAYFKGSSSPKDTTTISGGNGELAVFEGFFDFLSFIVMMGWQQHYPMDILVLNSLSFFERSLPLMDGYAKVRLYLDNDTAGKDCIRMALSRSVGYSDERVLYKNHNDLSEFLVHAGKPLSPGSPVDEEPP